MYDQNEKQKEGVLVLVIRKLNLNSASKSPQTEVCNFLQSISVPLKPCHTIAYERNVRVAYEIL